MSLEKMTCGVNYTTELIKDNINGLIDAHIESKSEESFVSSNAGVSFLKNEQVYEKLNTNMTINGSIGESGLTITKTASDVNDTWYGFKIAVNYESLEDLNTPLVIGFIHKSGQQMNSFNIVTGANSSWAPHNTPIFLNADTVNEPINLYERIMQESNDVIAVYEQKKALYINIAFYSGNDGGGFAASKDSEWFVNPYFKIKNSVVFASDLDQPLRENITDEIESKIASAVSGVEKYLIGWGDSLTAGGVWTTTIANLSGCPFYNGATGGENCHTIMARQGADAMVVNNITIPENPVQVLIADRDIDGGITTQMGFLATPLLQGGNHHTNPVKIGDIEGTLAFTGSGHSDMTGDWVFTRSEAGAEVVIDRPTQIRTNYDRKYNGGGIAIVFIGQNGGYSSIDDLVWQNKKMIEQARTDEYVVLGLSSGSAIERNDYELAMEYEFGRRFISLRQYLASPIYNEQGEIVNCYGLDDAGLTATQADIDAITEGKVPPQCLSDSVHYTDETKTVIGNMLYKKISELNFFKEQ